MPEKVQVKEFLNLLNKLKSGLSSGKQTTEQSDCFAFTKDRIWTYNDEISVNGPNPITFEGVVSSKELLSLIGKLTSEEMFFTFSSEEMTLKSGRIKAGIRIQEQIEMPVDEIVIPKKWHKLPNNFLSSLQKCIFSAGNDYSEPLLTCIHCKGKIVQSSDNERATKCILPETIKQEFLIPASSAKFLIGLEDVIEYKVTEEWVHFKTKDGIVFSSRCDVTPYPSLDDYFETKGFDFTFPREIISILERAGVFIETDFEQDKQVQISISSKGLFKVRAEGETGWIEETNRIKIKPKTDIQFSINPQYLQQILKQTNQAIIGKELVWFITDGFEHVVSLEE